MLRTLLSTLLPLALTACGLLQMGGPPGSASISRVDPEAICGPAPIPVTPSEATAMLALDQWLIEHLRDTRPQDLVLFQRRYLDEPTTLRAQIRTCRDLMAGAC